MLISIFACLVAIILGEHEWVPRLGAMWVVFSVLIEFRVSAVIRSENMESLIQSFMFQMRTTAEVEASKAIKLAYPDAKVRMLAGADVVSGMNTKLNAYEKPFSWLSMCLAILGTFIWAFGDWVTCFVHFGELCAC